MSNWNPRRRNPDRRDRNNKLREEVHASTTRNLRVPENGGRSRLDKRIKLEFWTAALAGAQKYLTTLRERSVEYFRESAFVDYIRTHFRVHVAEAQACATRGYSMTVKFVKQQVIGRLLHAQIIKSAGHAQFQLAGDPEKCWKVAPSYVPQPTPVAA